MKEVSPTEGASLSRCLLYTSRADGLAIEEAPQFGEDLPALAVSDDDPRAPCVLDRHRADLAGAWPLVLRVDVLRR